MKKMKKRSNGFTLTELAIVIAVIAILIAVLVPTFISLIDKAKKTSDTSLVTNVNKVMSINETPDNINEALEIAESGGYKVENLTTASSGTLILWDETSNKFIYVNSELDSSGNFVEVDGSALTADKWTLWVITESYNSTYSAYSQYISGTISTDLPTVYAGISVGSNTNIDVSYSGSTKQEVTFITNGGTLTINNASATVNHYGTATKVVVTAVASNSYHVYGKVTGNIEVTKGRVVLESSSTASSIYVSTSTASDVVVVNNSSNEVEIAAADKSVASTVSAAATGSGSTTYIDSNVSTAILTYFAGGFGTESNPYQISTAQQFKNIYVISQDCVSNSSNTYGYDADNLVYYELLNDVTLTEYYTVNGSNNVNTVYLAYAVFDGNGFTLDGANSTNNPYTTYLFYSISWGSTFKNVTVNLGGQTKAIAVNITSNSTLEDVTVTGRVNYEANNGVLSTYAWGTLTFTNCVNQATMIGKGYSTSYNGVFIGCNGGHDVDFTFNSCKNEGTLVCGRTALFMGNFYGSEATKCSITVNNCSNTGIIRSVYVDSSYTPNYYLAIGDSLGNVTYSVTVNGSAYSSFATAAAEHAIANASNETYDSATLTVNANKNFVITQSKYSDVDYYEITIGLYVQLYTYDDKGDIKKDEKGNYVSGGTSRYYITLTVDADLVSSDGYVSALQTLTFIDLATYLEVVGEDSFDDMKNDSTVTAVGDGYMVYANNQYYYLVNNSAVYFDGGTGTPTIFAVSMYDYDGYLISSVNGYLISSVNG